MHKIPPEYRPLIYIAFAFILFALFYFIFSPYQQCKRVITDAGRDNATAALMCGDRHSW